MAAPGDNASRSVATPASLKSQQANIGTVHPRIEPVQPPRP
jgi:hypothetical protein